MHGQSLEVVEPGSFDLAFFELIATEDIEALDLDSVNHDLDSSVQLHAVQFVVLGTVRGLVIHFVDAQVRCLHQGRSDVGASVPDDHRFSPPPVLGLGRSEADLDVGAFEFDFVQVSFDPVPDDPSQVRLRSATDHSGHGQRDLGPCAVFDCDQFTGATAATRQLADDQLDFVQVIGVDRVLNQNMVAIGHQAAAGVDDDSSNSQSENVLGQWGVQEPFEQETDDDNALDQGITVCFLAVSYQSRMLAHSASVTLVNANDQRKHRACAGYTHG